jgi:Kelch motif
MPSFFALYHYHTGSSLSSLSYCALPLCLRLCVLYWWYRIGHRAVAIGNRLIIYGGRTFKTNHFVKEASCYDTDKKAWLPANKVTRTLYCICTVCIIMIASCGGTVSTCSRSTLVGNEQCQWHQQLRRLSL